MGGIDRCPFWGIPNNQRVLIDGVRRCLPMIIVLVPYDREALSLETIKKDFVFQSAIESYNLVCVVQVVDASVGVFGAQPRAAVVA